MENETLVPMKKSAICSRFTFQSVDFCTSHFFDLKCPHLEKSDEEIVVLQALKLGEYFLIEYAYREEYLIEKNVPQKSRSKGYLEPEFSYFSKENTPKIKMETEILC